ncbi:MAG: protoglobin domain-containing protein [Myxococcota bacterium]
MPTYSPQAVAERLDWCQIGPRESELIVAFARAHGEIVGELVAAFYDHILSFDRSKRFFHDPDTLSRVKRLQHVYFERMLSGQYDVEYFEDRQRIGTIHARIGLGAEWFIGAYDILLKTLSLRLHTWYEDAETLRDIYLAFQRVAHLDIALAVDAYTSEREDIIARQQRLLTELPTPVLTLKEGLLLLPIVGALDAARTQRLTEELLEGVKGQRARVVVVDVTGVTELDTMVANNLVQAIRAAALMGAESVVTGVSTQVARTLVRLGVDVEQLNTVGDLRAGLEAAELRLAGG